MAKCRAKSQGCKKMTSERWQHYNVTFTQGLVGLLVKSVELNVEKCFLLIFECSSLAQNTTKIAKVN